MDDCIVQRIKKIMDFYKLNQTSFSERVGLKQSNLSKILSGERTCGDAVINKISMSFDIRKEWLLTGEGEMLKDSQINVTVSEKPTASLPLIPIDAVAGFPGEDKNGIAIEQCECYCVPEFADKGAQFLIRVSGSSMYPKYSNGDILACRKIESITFFQWGKVYVMDTCQGALVKRIFEDKDDKDNVICHSDNHDNYPDFKLPKSEIRSLSIVLGVIRME